MQTFPRIMKQLSSNINIDVSSEIQLRYRVVVGSSDGVSINQGTFELTEEMNTVFAISQNSSGRRLLDKNYRVLTSAFTCILYEYYFRRIRIFLYEDNFRHLIK